MGRGPVRMIRAIAAVDDSLGLANGSGIPWRIPADIEYFRSQTAAGSILMGYTTYTEFLAPVPGRINNVAAAPGRVVREGFRHVTDVGEFVRGAVGDLWIIGGAKLFARTLDHVEELYLTRVVGDFACTSFFPDSFKRAFALITDKPVAGQPGTPDCRFQVWRRS